VLMRMSLHGTFQTRRGGTQVGLDDSFRDADSIGRRNILFFN